MPGLDRTGPGGQGSRTGRQLGKCHPKQEERTEEGPYQERGMGRVRGMGRGAGHAAGRASSPKFGRGRNKGWKGH